MSGITRLSMPRIARWLKPNLYQSMSATALASIVTACITVFVPASAHVHHGADGHPVSWYPGDCCNNGDCHPVSRIEPISRGLLMTTEDGITLLVSGERYRRPSLDDRWHVCFGRGEEPVVHCVFEPPNS